MAEKPILVAGKSGQLARCLRDLAFLRNVPMVAVGRPELDLENGEGVDRVTAAVEPSAIVNAAAYTAVDRAEAEPERAFAVNCDGAALLADAAARRGIPFIQISTDYVFDGAKDGAYLEDDVVNPQNVYGKSKLAGEQAIAASGCKHLIFRTSWVYGTRGKNFLLTMLRLGADRDELSVVADQIGAPTWSNTIAALTSNVLAQAVGGSADWWKQNSGVSIFWSTMPGSPRTAYSCA